MAEDFAVARARFRHPLCAPLTQADSVALANSVQNDRVALAPCREIVAGHGIPSKAAINGKAPCFAFADQACSFLL